MSPSPPTLSGGQKLAPTRRVSPRLSAAKPAAANTNKDGQLVVDLMDDDENDHTAKTESCLVCINPVDPATTRFAAPCGHVFCKTCLQQRCQRALQNEEQSSIGLPVRCCQRMIPLDVVRPALSKRAFVKYEGLVAKRGDAVGAVTRKRSNANANASRNKRQRTGASAPTDAGETTADTVCVACIESATEPLRAPCTHVYCVNCVAMMARQSLEDRSRVPIRCCGHEFPIDYVQRVLPKTKYLQYQRFVAEKDWRQSDLKSDKEYAQVVKKARAKQCPTCGVGVEKISGCDAVRCPQGHVFCFKCGRAPCTCGRTHLESYG